MQLPQTGQYKEVTTHAISANTSGWAKVFLRCSSTLYINCLPLLFNAQLPNWQQHRLDCEAMREGCDICIMCFCCQNHVGCHNMEKHSPGPKDASNWLFGSHEQACNEMKICSTLHCLSKSNFPPLKFGVTMRIECTRSCVIVKPPAASIER